MGLDIGIMKIEYLERPGGVVYDFAWHLAQEGAFDAYMFGEGNSCIPFTQRQVLRTARRVHPRAQAVAAGAVGDTVVDRVAAVDRWLAGRAPPKRWPRPGGRLPPRR